MDHALVLELLWLFSYPEIRHGFLYFGYFEGSASGQTLGKRALGIRDPAGLVSLSSGARSERW